MSYNRDGKRCTGAGGGGRRPVGRSIFAQEPKSEAGAGPASAPEPELWPGRDEIHGTEVILHTPDGAEHRLIILDDDWETKYAVLDWCREHGQDYNRTRWTLAPESRAGYWADWASRVPGPDDDQGDAPVCAFFEALAPARDMDNPALALTEVDEVEAQVEELMMAVSDNRAEWPDLVTARDQDVPSGMRVLHWMGITQPGLHTSAAEQRRILHHLDELGNWCVKVRRAILARPGEAAEGARRVEPRSGNLSPGARARYRADWASRLPDPDEQQAYPEYRVLYEALDSALATDDPALALRIVEQARAEARGTDRWAAQLPPQATDFSDNAGGEAVYLHPRDAKVSAAEMDALLDWCDRVWAVLESEA